MLVTQTTIIASNPAPAKLHLAPFQAPGPVASIYLITHITWLRLIASLMPYYKLSLYIVQNPPKQSLQ